MSHETQSLNRVRDQAQKQARDLNGFDYGAPAELYPKFRPRYCSVRTLRSTRRASGFRKSASSTTAPPIR